MCVQKMRLSCDHARALVECLSLSTRMRETLHFQPCRRRQTATRRVLKGSDMRLSESSEIFSKLSSHTLNKVRRLSNIVADLSEDVVDVLLGLHEDLQRWVHVLFLSRVSIHQRVVAIRCDVGESALEVSGHRQGIESLLIWKDKSLVDIQNKCVFVRLRSIIALFSLYNNNKCERISINFLRCAGWIV